MASSKIHRRTFHQLTAAALGGIAAGSVAGCGGERRAAPGPALTADVHLCRGLNDCKGKGKGGDNACRGQGSCATAKEHACGGQNECKGLGGCGETAGENSCQGKGGCHVPLMDHAWEKLRKKLETQWSEKKQNFAAAPAKT